LNKVAGACAPRRQSRDALAKAATSEPLLSKRMDDASVIAQASLAEHAI
jgi:hypothetical protein